MNMQDHKIILLKLGMTNCYLIRGGENYVMVDAGPPNSQKKFREKLELFRIDPAKIKLIFITHMHFDHMGSLTGISQLTGAKSAMHHLDKKLVEKGLVIMPRGIGTWGKILTAFLWTIKPLVNRAMKQSWQLLLDEGARHIYPSHGKPFDAGVFEKYLKS
jgi:glyoxylase-like metal-dependent hydrolase (beta-lactamase superfamily II)